MRPQRQKDEDAPANKAGASCLVSVFMGEWQKRRANEADGVSGLFHFRLPWAVQYLANLIADLNDIARVILRLHVPANKAIRALQCVVRLIARVVVNGQFIRSVANKGAGSGVVSAGGTALILISKDDRGNP